MAVNRFHVEAWSLPLETTTRIVARVPFITGSYSDPLSSQSGIGSIMVRSDWTRLTDIIDPDNNVSSLLVIYQDNAYIGAFYADRTEQDLSDTGLVKITGRHIAASLAHARVLNFDYPTQPTADPDWVWGSPTDVKGFANPSFEESIFWRTGKRRLFERVSTFETGTTEGWEPIPGSNRFEPNTKPPDVDTADAHTGSYSLFWTPGTPTSGVFKPVTVNGGQTYTFNIRVKSATTGRRFLFGVDLPSGATASHTNAFTINGVTYAELDNAAEGTGSTDGTWQLCTLTVAYPDFENLDNDKALNVYVLYKGSGAGALTRLDQYVAQGPGFGLKPWKPKTQDYGDSLVTWEQDSTHTDPLDTSSVYALHVQTDDVMEGAKQRFGGWTYGKTYTFTARVYHETGSNQDFTVRISRAWGDGVIQQSTTSVPTATWTTLTVTAVNDDPDGELKVAVLKNTAGEFWVDSTTLREGRPATSWGDIWQELLDDVTTDHTAETAPFDVDALGYIDYTSFTASLDSAGNAWAPATVQYRANRGKKFSMIASEGVKIGYEYRIVFNPATPAVELDWFNPYDWTTRTGGVGTNRVGTGVPELMDVAGTIVKQPAAANRVYTEGEDQRWDVARDATAESNFGTRMLYEGDINLLGDTTLSDVADQFLAERVTPQTSIKIDIDPGDSGAIPYRDFICGDTYPINIPGVFTGSKRVVNITTTFGPDRGRYSLEFDAESYAATPGSGGTGGGGGAPRAVAEGVRRLLEKVEALEAEPDATSGETLEDVVDFPTGTGAVPTFLIAATDARDEIRAIADYLCDGTADDVEMLDALAACETLGAGRVFLSEGTFTLAASATLTVGDTATNKKVSLVGAGHGVTTINGVAANPATLTMEQRALVADIEFNNVQINITGASTRLSRCMIEGDQTNQSYAVQHSGGTPTIHDCYIGGGSLAALRLQSQAKVSNVVLNPTGGDGLDVNGDGNVVSNVTIHSPDDHGIHLTSTAEDNLLSNVYVIDAWSGAGSGPAIYIESDNNVLVGVKVGFTASAAFTYAIETAATADTTVLGIYELSPGTTGTINDLGTNTYDYRNAGTASPLTTKGDLWGYDTADNRIPVGTDNQVLTADSAQTLGVKWATPASGSPLTTKGDIHGYDTADARLAVGTNGQVLTADSTAGIGIAWAASDAGTGATAIPGYGEDNLAASLTSSQLYRNIQGIQAQVPVVTTHAGSVIGVSVASSEARTAGTATFEVFKNGTGTGLSCVLNGTDTQYAQASQAVDLDTFVAGDRLDVRVTTDGTWAPTTADVEATIIVGVDDIGGAATAGALVETIASGTPATLTLSSIPTGYDDLKIVGVIRSTRTGSAWDFLEINVGNGTVDTGSNYWWGWSFDGSAENAGDDGGVDTKWTEALGLVTAADSTANEFTAFEMTIFDYERTALHRRFHLRASFTRSGTVFIVADMWGRWADTTNVIDIVQFGLTNGNFVNDSYVRAYGI